MAYSAPNLYQPTFENTSPIASALKAVGGLQSAMQGGMETQYLPQQLQANLQQQQQAAKQAGIQTQYMPAQLAAEIKNLMSNAGLNMQQAMNVLQATQLMPREFGLNVVKTGYQYPVQSFMAQHGLAGMGNLSLNQLQDFVQRTNPFSSNQPSNTWTSPSGKVYAPDGRGGVVRIK